MWKDLGTWNTLTEAMDESIIGKGELNDKCSGVHIINEMDVPVLAMGLHDVVISASPEGILVSDKEQSSYIKPFVDKFEQQIMFAEKSWGSFKVVDVETTSLTIKVTLNPGHSMNYHSHRNRDEVWVVISGEGKTIVDGMEQMVKPGDVITMSAGRYADHLCHHCSKLSASDHLTYDRDQRRYTGNLELQLRCQMRKQGQRRRKEHSGSNAYLYHHHVPSLPVHSPVLCSSVYH